MVAKQPRYSPEEHARLGTEIYEQRIRPKVEVGNRGKIVAIDVDSEEFEIGKDGMSAAKQLLARRPTAQIWCVRIGYPAVHRFGIRAKSVRS